MSSAIFFDAITIFWGIIIESLPFILFGVLVSTLFHLYVSRDAIIRHLPKNPGLASVFGMSLGMAFPVCECGNIPFAKRMMQYTIPPHVVIAFLLSAPILNPLVLFTTYSAFPDTPFVLFARVGGAVLIALSMSAIVYLFPHMLEPRSRSEHPHTHSHSFSHVFLEEWFFMMKMLTLGAFIAAMSQILFQFESIVTLGESPIMSVVSMMILGGVISICSSVDAFFALGYSHIFTLPSLVAFLVYGPIIDIKIIIMMLALFKPIRVFQLSITITLIVFLYSLCLYWLL